MQRIFFGSVGFNKKDPPLRHPRAAQGPVSQRMIQYTTFCGTKKAHTGFFTGNTSHSGKNHTAERREPHEKYKSSAFLQQCSAGHGGRRGPGGRGHHGNGTEPAVGQAHRTQAGQGRGTRHEPAGHHGHGSRGAQDGPVRKNKKAGPAGSAFLLAIYFWFQIHIRALVLISPRTCRSIWMLQVTRTDLFTSLPVSTEAGRFLMVSTAVALLKSPVRMPS